jgi:hypothetical protein
MTQSVTPLILGAALGALFALPACGGAAEADTTASDTSALAMPGGPAKPSPDCPDPTKIDCGIPQNPAPPSRECPDPEKIDCGVVLDASCKESTIVSKTCKDYGALKDEATAACTAMGGGLTDAKPAVGMCGSNRFNGLTYVCCLPTLPPGGSSGAPPKK